MLKTVKNSSFRRWLPWNHGASIDDPLGKMDSSRDLQGFMPGWDSCHVPGTQARSLQMATKNMKFVAEKFIRNRHGIHKGI